MISGLALSLSGYTWLAQHRRQVLAERQADVSVAFHWLSTRAHVTIPGHGDFDAGYHLVLTNKGPAAARDLDVQLTDSDDHPLKLLDLVPGELPLVILDNDGRYPIPWIYEPFSRHARRFEAMVSWTDNAGCHGSPRDQTFCLFRGSSQLRVGS
ncbi:MAG: hypothetical protein M3Y49_03300 [Actinomycetota bacterium]|nr:hypothetical protein [Actinomycetota bacterium]